MPKASAGDIPEHERLENIRVAYQAAIALRTSRAEELWLQFNAMVVVQSILVATSLGLSVSHIQTRADIGVAVLGCVLSVLWLLVHLRGTFWIRHYRDCALHYERQLVGIDTIAAGLDRRMRAGILTVTNGAMVIILAFAAAHLILLASHLSER